MGTRAYGGRGSKGRTLSGVWPNGAASCRPKHTNVSYLSPGGGGVQMHFFCIFFGPSWRSLRHATLLPPFSGASGPKIVPHGRDLWATYSPMWGPQDGTGYVASLMFAPFSQGQGIHCHYFVDEL